MKAFGTTVSINDTPIAHLTAPDISGAGVTNIDTTAHDSTDGVKTYVGGLIDNGELSLAGKYDPEDDGQLALIAAVGTVAEFIRTLPGSYTETFDGVVHPVNISAPLDGEVTFTCSVKISGAVLRAGGGS